MRPGQFAKVFASLWKGTLGLNWEGWSLFVYMLATCTVDGEFDVTPQVISAGTGMPLDAVLRGIAVLEAADPHSRTPGENGARIVRLDEHREWGWRIVNFDKYRAHTEDPRNVLIRTRRRRARMATTYDDDSRRNAPPRDDTRRHARTRTATNGHAPPREAEAEAEDFSRPSVACSATAERLSFSDSEISEDSNLFGSSELETGSGKKRHGAKRSKLAKTELPADEISADQAFVEIFWPEYPRKVGLRHAEKAWKRLHIRDDDEAMLQAIMAGLRRDIATEWAPRTIDLIPYASTWLNQRRWEDQR